MADIQSWVSLWVCLVLALVLIAIRLILRRFRGQAFTRGDSWCMVTAGFILARLISNHILLLYGSTRTLSAARRLELLDGEHDDELFKVVTGSKLILCTRSLLICCLWSAKMAVLDLLSRLIMKLPFERKVLYAFWAALLLTFIASIVTVFTTCTPFQRFWQIHPNPGDCTIGSMWIYTYEIGNIVTDVLLMAVPFSLILSVKIAIMQRLRILLLFSIGMFLISISIVRIIRGRDSRSQAGHTLWASLEVLFASIVAVTPTTYALAQNSREDTTYGKSHDPSKTTGGRTFPGSVVDGDKYTARIWTELADGTSRDNSSATGILVQTSFRTENA
ncbi:hypothetical protein CC86DRAFT_393481 [Ophiobolus disseminans]|uniref:Rhodopsin domain-containing protein n=1 Tax=Ophiobolus disseminans TaxID=1469910 RepID=A0A6A7A2I7_9PLEO|nr:hypothetical protein CC86DRAFT_393481 [Ophiobolus disseminans]